MSRLTSEQAVRAVGNKFDLVLIVSRRVRELHQGWAPHITVKKGENATSIAMKEVEQGHVGRDYLLKNSCVAPVRQRQK